MRIVAGLWLVLGVACKSAVTVVDEEVPAHGIFALAAEIDEGDFEYRGRRELKVFDVQYTSRGFGSQQEAADRREAANDYGSLVDVDLLELWGRTSFHQARVDILVDGPDVIDIEALLHDGDATLSNAVGSHLVTADRVVGLDLVGDLDLYARESGLDVEVWPFEAGTIRLEAVGDVVLSLPWGLEYDLEAFVDPAYGYEVTDLGFGDLRLYDDLVRAMTGSRSIRVEVYVEGGTFFLWEYEGTR